MHSTRSTDRAAISIAAAILLSSLTSSTGAAIPIPHGLLPARVAGEARAPLANPFDGSLELGRFGTLRSRSIVQFQEERDLHVKPALSFFTPDPLADPARDIVEPVPVPDAVTAAAAVLRDEIEIDRAVTRWERSGRKRSIDVLDPLLSIRIQGLRRRSESFDQAWIDLEHAGVPILIGTDAQLRAQIPRGQRDGSWAGITVNWGDGRHTVIRSAVAIRVDWLLRLHDSFGNPEEVFLEALDGLLIHEVYGHLVPVVTAGTLGAACADAAPGTRHRDSCVGKRERVVEADLQRSAAKLAHGL